MKSSSYSLYFILFSLITLLSFYLVTIYPILNYDSDRIYNLRAAPDKYRSSLLEHFLDNRYEEGSVLLLGDSQVYGYEHPTEYIFSTLLANKLNRKVINVAFQDSRTLDNIYALKYAIRKNMKFDAIVFNATQTHVKRPEFSRLDIKNSVDYRFGLLGESQAFYEFTNEFTPQNRYHDNFYEFTNGAHYFKWPEENLYIYMANLNRLIGLAKLISKDVIVYLTPYDAADIIRRELNVSNVDKFAKAANIVCKNNEVLCIIPNISAREYYFDIVHFTVKGHIVMADLLFSVINRGMALQ
jgi:hypothetical protein